MALAAIDDHVSRALARVRLQFRDSADVLGVLSALAKEVQALEDALIALNAEFRSYTTATGATLENIGKIVASPMRGGRSDLDFSGVVGASIVRNKSFGGLADLYNIAWSLLTYPGFWGDSPIVIDANDPTPGQSGIVGGPGVAVVESLNGFGETGITVAKLQEVMIFLQATAPAGVRVILAAQVTPNNAASVFTFDGNVQPLDLGKLYTAIDRV